MALDTTIGGSGSDSFITLAAWETYATSQGWTTVGTDAIKEAYLRRAANVLTRKYGWAGDRQYQVQVLSWPRSTNIIVHGWPVLSSIIPQDIQDAQAELAWLIHEGLDPTATVTNGAIKSESVSAGPVSSGTTYVGGGRETPRLVAVEGLIAPYLSAPSGQVRMQRG